LAGIARAVLTARYQARGEEVEFGRHLRRLLSYLERRDETDGPLNLSGLEGFSRDCAWRHRTQRPGALFDARGPVAEPERTALYRHVVHTSSRLFKYGRTHAQNRAYYLFVISPPDARRLELRALARAVMTRLEEDSGPLPPWLAAEHHNTPHPHVHVILAGQRSGPQGTRTLLLTRPRLASMKLALAAELERQQGLELRPRRLEADLARRLAGLRPELGADPFEHRARRQPARELGR